MFSRSATLIVRAMRLAPVMACLIGSRVCFSQPAYAQAPAPAEHADTTAPAGQLGTPAVSPAAAATSVPTVDTPARRSFCQGAIAVLSGRKQDRALLDKAEVKDFLQLVPDLVTCGAVMRDSDDLCKRLNVPGDAEPGPALSTPVTTKGFIPEGPYKSCRDAWSNFHELRTDPKGRGFMFNDINWQECHEFKELAASCDHIRAVFRAGDASQCASLSQLESLCRAHIVFDKSLCLAPHGSEFFEKYGADFAKQCLIDIDGKAFLAKGLKALAESDRPRERQFAKAALGQTDACAPFEKSAMEVCTGSGGTTMVPAGTPGTAAAGTPGPAAPLSDTPAAPAP